MAIFWISECLPLAITSLLPLVLLPLAGVSGTKEVIFLHYYIGNVLATVPLQIQSIVSFYENSHIHIVFR